MRTWVVLTWLVLGCQPPAPAYTLPPQEPLPASIPASSDPVELGRLDDRMIDFVFEGGQLEFELYRNGGRIVQVARSRYAVPVVIAWSMTALDNLAPLTPTEGAAYLPPAAGPAGPRPPGRARRAGAGGQHPAVPPRALLPGALRQSRARPAPYAYALPYPAGLTFSVLQGFHGAFSHHGSNEYAVDFDCPVATPVLAARPGVVVVANASAQGSGTTPEYLDYKRTNFVLILHDDGTLGEYMHLAPSSVGVKPGQRVERRERLALSGNTGFSSTPHLHFQVMTAATDGVAAVSFPFKMAVAPGRVDEPVQGHRYAAWE